ncbi:MAG: hypothetical protein EPO53_36745 [Variovorax sp.]|jgi:hypothetical protein|nr:MAG: hypothetical protein EPO53_36745 [Variovorax sp.]
MNIMGHVTLMGSLDSVEGGISVDFGPKPRREAPPATPGLGLARRRPFASVAAAIAAIEALDRELRKFELAVDDVLQDYLGVQMAQITDCALTRGWEPVGFVQDEGFRVYRYERVRGRSRQAGAGR